MERPVISGPGQRTYQKHSIERKRRIVEETLKPGASVARVARANGVNANQVFGWRKLQREGLLGTDAKLGVTLVPVTMTIDSEPRQPPVPVADKAPALLLGRLQIESAKGCLTIEGQPDPVTLRLVLNSLLG